jgi:hypothetical protein
VDQSWIRKSEKSSHEGHGGHGGLRFAVLRSSLAVRRSEFCLLTSTERSSTRTTTTTTRTIDAACHATNGERRRPGPHAKGAENAEGRRVKEFLPAVNVNELTARTANSEPVVRTQALRDHRASLSSAHYPSDEAILGGRDQSWIRKSKRIIRGTELQDGSKYGIQLDG